MVGDWDGNGKANPGVRNPDTKTFKLKAGKNVTEIKFGGRSDLAIVGDWDGDGLWEVGTRRATSNLFRLRAADGTVTKVRLGDADDLPVTGDWDGDGDTDLGVFDSATATYTLRQVDDTGMEWLSQVALGAPGYLPVVGDWDANGVTDLGVWDPDTASFSMRKAPSPTKQGKAKVVRTGRRRLTGERRALAGPPHQVRRAVLRAGQVEREPVARAASTRTGPSRAAAPAA